MSERSAPWMPSCLFMRLKSTNISLKIRKSERDNEKRAAAAEMVSVTGEGVEQLEDVTVQQIPPFRQLPQESLHAKIMESLEKSSL